MDDLMRRYIEATKRVMREARDPYARSYAGAAPAIDPEWIATQIAYILSNLGHWRGQVARETKAELAAIQRECKKRRRK
jgi:hypothetical protein